jgi:hypothetical protein
MTADDVQVTMKKISEARARGEARDDRRRSMISKMGLAVERGNY